MGDGGAAHLASLCQLTSLNLAGRSNITAAGLTFLEHFKNLHALDLSLVRLDSGSASFLWELTQLTCLRLGTSKVCNLRPSD